MFLTGSRDSTQIKAFETTQTFMVHIIFTILSLQGKIKYAGSFLFIKLFLINNSFSVFLLAAFGSTWIWVGLGSPKVIRRSQTQTIPIQVGGWGEKG